MNTTLNRAFALTVLIAAFPTGSPLLQGAASTSEPAWRSLPLVTNGKVDPSWVHVGWGGFVVEDGTLRTEPAAKGLGLLLYKKEHLGNCQIRVVFKAKDAKSNSGIYVRLADGILKQVGKPGAAFDRDATGKISKESMAKMQESGERDEGPWYAVHHGYEVQIADGGDAFHCTGSIYSLAPSSAVPTKGGEWRTMVVTLNGGHIVTELDGQRVARVDTGSTDLPPRKQWHEPKREPKRPEAGYVGLQNHDPGDIVWFKEVSVRPLPPSGAK
jgi:3-keto-disaccharide hydrolase